MIILRQRHFSMNQKKMEEVIKELDKLGVEDYDISSKVLSDNISIGLDNRGLVNIYLPLDYEYTQYDVDDYIRRNLGAHYRTTTTLDRNIYIQKVGQVMKSKDIAKLIEWIVENEEFCTVIE